MSLTDDAAVPNDYGSEAGALTVIGKGNKHRTVYATNGGATALDASVAVRGSVPGPLLAPVSMSGTVAAVAGITAHALVKLLQRRAAQAGITARGPRGPSHHRPL